MPLDLVSDFVHGLDPVIFASARLGFRPDPWQAQLLRSPARQIALNVCRQGGKSTTVAILALHTSLYALYDPGALILLVSPSQRQSRELFTKVTDFLRSLEPAEILEEDNRLSCSLRNQSRIVSLPGDPRTIRGFSAPALVVEDEAGYVPDEVYTALRPMMAVSQGRLILMSTPAGRRGHYYEVWTGGEGWERIKIVGSECPRISAEFLEQERRELGPLFAQEYEGQFIEDNQSMFDDALIADMFTDDFPPFQL
jgi:hypothetical protein